MLTSRRNFRKKVRVCHYLSVFCEICFYFCLLQEFKSFLKEFIDKTATLETDIEEGKAPMGFLFQVNYRWLEFAIVGGGGMSFSYF
jgi:hypothetical protein